MKPLKIIPNQIKSFLIMARILFPEYTIIDWNLLVGGYIKFWDNRMPKAKLIHWLEFLQFHLVKKMFIKYKVQEGDCEEDEFLDWWEDNDFHSIFTNRNLKSQHPIDFLYILFKKIK